MIFSSPLQRAIKRGLKPGGNLREELSKLDNYQVTSRKDGRSICAALAQIPGPIDDSPNGSPLHSLTALFQDVAGADCPAFEVLRDEGVSQLARIFDVLIASESADDRENDLLFILKVLSLYGSREGAQRVVSAARLPFHAENYFWSIALGCYKDGHPERDYVFESLSDPLPPGFIAVSLLDAANQECLAEGLEHHPFDTHAGIEQLRKWLTSDDPDEFSYARSAAVALPFIDSSAGRQLLGLAREHRDRSVCIEAAWASARAGQKIGFDILVEHCLDVRTAAIAASYLEELERADLIPQAAKEPDFVAKARFSQWLEHPNELTCPPDELNILDKRTLFWPPTREECEIWLIKYLLRDTTNLEPDDANCGVVGPHIWCFFMDMLHRPVEDVYAIHCCWECMQSDLIHELDEDLQEYEGMLRQWNGAAPKNACIAKVFELSHKLTIDTRLVAIASADINGEAGWLALDGAHSTWYPKSQFLPDEIGSIVLKIHVGRRLLGFQELTDRRRFFCDPPRKPAPDVFIRAFESILDELREGSHERRIFLLTDYRSPISAPQLKKYVDYKAAEAAGGPTPLWIRVFDELVAASEQLSDTERTKALGSFNLTGTFEEYTDSLIANGQQARANEQVAFFEPLWQHNLGYGLLGSAAFKAGDHATAERLLVNLIDSHTDWQRSEEMGHLAEIWHLTGRSVEARKLLLDCLTHMRDLAQSTGNSDREMFESEFQHHREAFLRLFPSDIAALQETSIPESAIRSQ